MTRISTARSVLAVSGDCAIWNTRHQFTIEPKNRTRKPGSAVTAASRGFLGVSSSHDNWHLAAANLSQTESTQCFGFRNQDFRKTSLSLADQGVRFAVR